MKYCYILLVACLFGIRTYAQTATSADLVKQGIKLHDAGKFAEAIDTYQQALKADPANMQAEFEMAYSMFSSGKGTDAIPHLEKVLKNDESLAPGAYDLLGSIYDDSKQPEKAIALYQQGIKANPQYQRLHYNLALALLRQQKYKEAESSIIEAIKLDPKHASSQQIYAYILQQQNKGAAAVMVYCNFLMLEPQTQRSVQAYQQMQNIIQSRVKVNTENGITKSMSITVQDNKDSDKDMFAIETMLAMAAAAPTIDKDKNKTKAQIWEDQLKTIFGVAGELSAKKKDKDFFWKFYADYFYKLSASVVMPTFARVTGLAGDQQETIQWFKDHPQALDELNAWTKTAERSF